MKKILTLILIFSVIFTAIGCSTADYNAKIVKDYSVNYNWLQSNLTNGAIDAEADAELPDTRTFIVVDDNTLNEIFDELPEADFENEMVIVYCYTDVYSREYAIENVIIDGDALIVDLEIKSNFLSSLFMVASAPFTRVCVIKLNKIDVTNVQIVF